MDDRTRPPGTDPLDPVYLREEAKAPKSTPAPLQPVGATAPAKSTLRRAILIVLAALIAFGTYRFIKMDHSSATGPAPQAAQAQPVGVATVAKGDINILVSGLGTVTPLANVTVKTQINGQLIDVGFKEGQMVKKGDFLAQIDPRPYQVAKEQFEGQRDRDQGLLDQARNNMQRFQTLLKQDSIARQTAEDQIYLVKQYEGALKADQAQIDAQTLNLTYARIVSPLDGRVGLRLVDPGNYVQTSDTGIAVITQLHPISVIFTVPEDELQAILDRMNTGAELPVSIFDRAYVNKLATGKLSNVDNQIDATTGTIKIRAEFDNLDDKLFPNQFVNAQLLIDTLRGAVTAPVTAIQRGAPGTYVYLVGADDKVVMRKVTLGPQEGGRVAITAGLAPGDRVVVDGTDRLRDGAEVSIAAIDGVATDPPAKDQAGATPDGKSGHGSRRHGQQPGAQ
ncbi:efflux transporter, RND family, MFP subunit [Methylocella silvestris BL2]|uniref:Efflux transporter, RND family, MFP subunit n=1 Tax=Methylocella silvestris (strain DSM 15510 / CIP 108128 / LMG 27833 / NCIMB 13906 / BL2) TaxID=395965 RepID=B8EN16_METSB|nr:efflux RND transporter periplasmic adaptor subunit [Methylocella silvestris]ACK49151.1 efflux transporter, RND family, MFP subunit [Methylocella silvestris BL2]